MPAEGKPLCFKDVFLEGLPGNITNMTPRSAPPAHIGSSGGWEMKRGAVLSAAQRQPGPGADRPSSLGEDQSWRQLSLFVTEVVPIQGTGISQLSSMSSHPACSRRAAEEQEITAGLMPPWVHQGLPHLSPHLLWLDARRQKSSHDSRFKST